MNNIRSALVPVYFIVWAVLAIGLVILYRVRRDAEFRIRWYAKISFLTGIIILTFMLLISPSRVASVFICACAGLIMYLSLTKTTICKICGRIIQPAGFFQRAQYCPHCRGETVCSKLFVA